MIVERLQTARRATVRHALAAERAGFASHEQALTEVVLTRAAPAVQVSTFSQREEARTGADWLWWWRGRGEWFGALVQAKRNKPLHSRPWYDFGYRTNSGSRQVDRLLDTAKRLEVPAVYVLYNHPAIPPSVSVSSPCCTLPSEGWRTRLRVAVLPALMAETLVGGNEELAVRYARPLECLACTGLAPRLIPKVRLGIEDSELLQFLSGQSLDLPQLVARGLLAQLADMRLGQFRQAPSDFGPSDLDMLDRVFRDLPTDAGHFAEPYFGHVLRGLRTRPPEYVTAVLEGVPMEELGPVLEAMPLTYECEDDFG